MTYESLIPGQPEPEQLVSRAPLNPFDSAALTFVDQLSASLLRSPEARLYPELVALAFWMRRANLEALRRSLADRVGGALLVPRGTVFHIAPSNVDTIFVYSWFLSLLVGNRNIVRLSTKHSIQTEILVRAIATLLERAEHAPVTDRNLLVRYAANDAINARFSAVCDVRVIWGGDDTVARVRAVPLPATATEVSFANKYSLALIHAEGWLAAAEAMRDQWAERFYNDAYGFDQMACSSPRLVLWVGERAVVDSAGGDFWVRVARRVSARTERFGDADYVNKLVAADSLAIDANVHLRSGEGNDLVRVWLDEPDLHVERHCGAGLFFEARIDSLAALRPLLSRAVQTLTYAGFAPDELRRFVAEAPLAGIDRIVPVGQALDFAPVWDGFDLMRVFMREVTVV